MTSNNKNERKTKHKTTQKTRSGKSKSSNFLWSAPSVPVRTLTMGAVREVHRELTAGMETKEWLQMMLGDAEAMLTKGIREVSGVLEPIIRGNVEINLAALVAKTKIPGGMANELPYTKTKMQFHNVLWHMFHQCIAAEAVLADDNLMLLDVSGTTESMLFNNEDLVYYNRVEDRIYLVDLTTNTHGKSKHLVLRSEDIAQFQPTIGEKVSRTNRAAKSRAGIIEDLAEGKAPEYNISTVGDRMLRDLSKGMTDATRKKPLAMLTVIINLTNKLPGVKITYEVRKIERSRNHFIPVDMAKIGVRSSDEAAMSMIDALADAAIKPDYARITQASMMAILGSAGAPKVQGKRPPAGSKNVAKGMGTVQEMVEMVKFMRENGMANLVDKMHECYRYTACQKEKTKGIPPPSDRKTYKRVAIQDDRSKLLGFLKMVQNDGKPGIVYSYFLGKVSEHSGEGARWGYQAYGYHGSTVWAKAVSTKGKEGVHKEKSKLIQVGCTTFAPDWLHGALMHKRRQMYEDKGWEETGLTDEALCELIADDRTLVERLAVVNRSNIPSTLDRAARHLHRDNSVPRAMQLLRQHAREAINIIDSTVAGQMLNMNCIAGLACMRAARYRADEHCFRIEEHAGATIHTMARISGHIATWKGGCVVMFVQNAVQNTDSSYVDMQDPISGNMMTKCIMVHPAFLRKTATASAKVLSLVSNVYANSNTIGYASGLHLRMTAAHVALLSLNGRRSFGVSIYASRWMGNIASGMSGDLNAVSEKVMYATCINRVESLTIAESVILRHGAIAAMRDSWDTGSHIAETSDGSRSVMISPPGTWGITMTLQGYINSWYNAEVTHGQYVDADLANARVIIEAAGIVGKSQIEENVEAGCGMPLVYYHALLHKRRTAAQIVLDDDFEDIMVDHAAKVAAMPNKFAWSLYSVYAASRELAVPAKLWEAVEGSLATTNMSAALTSKRALVSNTDRSETNYTDMACLAFSLPSVMAKTKRYKDYRADAATMMTDTEVAYQGGSALTAFARALASGEFPCSQLVDKSDSVEKRRMIAMMNLVLRWAALVIEVPCQRILEAARDGLFGYEMKTSALMHKDKHKTMARMRAEGFKRMREDSDAGQRFTMIPIMNDCSGWGPMKILASVYCSIVALGPSKAMRKILNLAFRLFMCKKMVTTANVVKNASAIKVAMAASVRKEPIRKTALAADKKIRVVPHASVLDIISRDKELLDAEQNAMAVEEMDWDWAGDEDASDAESADEQDLEVAIAMEIQRSVTVEAEM